jgi:hypothetical protein
MLQQGRSPDLQRQTLAPRPVPGKRGAHISRHGVRKKNASPQLRLVIEFVFLPCAGALESARI